MKRAAAPHFDPTIDATLFKVQSPPKLTFNKERPQQIIIKIRLAKRVFLLPIFSIVTAVAAAMGSCNVFTLVAFKLGPLTTKVGSFF